MVRNKFCLLLVVLIFILSVISILSLAADFDTNELCLDDDECTLLNENGDKHYCNYDTNTCFRIVKDENEENVSSDNETEEAAASAPESDLDDLNDKVALLEGRIAAVESEIAVLKSDAQSAADNILSLQSTLNNLQEEVNILRQQQESGLQQLNSQVSVGLAGVQQGIDETKSELSDVKETVDKEKTFSGIITVVFFILLAVAVAVGIIYFLGKRGELAGGASAVSPEIVNYITSHIKQGSKYPQIKDNLLKAGWSESDIDWAYKETIKHNYKRFKAGAEGTTRRAERVTGVTGTTRKETGRVGKGISSDRAKIITIVIVSILLVAGVILILQGTIGKAIYYGKDIVEGGKVQYTVSCTPPHILTPEGDACCLDNKTIYSNGTVLLGTSNGVCDAAERAVEEAGIATGSCTDNNQCLSGGYCIDGQCQTLASFYKGIGDCSKMCEIYGIKISTSDGETYDTKPKKGSYTAAGALEWKVMTMPAHCKGEPPAVAIKIIRKKPGQIVNEEVVVLKEGQTSKVLKHPDFASISFTLKAERIFYTCPE